MSKQSSLFPKGTSDKLRLVSATMRALSHPLRLQMLQLLDVEAGACVRTIYQTLAIEQSVASQHLRILRLADLVMPERRGKLTFYNVNYSRVKKGKLAAAVFNQE